MSAKVAAVEHLPAIRPKLIVLRGQSARGKSTFARVMVHRAEVAKRALVIADADRSMPTNPMLNRFLDGVLHPGDVTEAQMYEWYRDVIDAQAETGNTVVLDTAGGDHSWPEFADEVGLEEMLSGLEVPIQLVQVLLLGPVVAELDIFNPKERHRIVASPNLIIVLNEAVGPPGAGEAAFEKVRKHQLYRDAIGVGAHEVFLPRLRCLDRMNDAGMSFKKAQEKLGFTEKQAVQSWLRRVDERLKPVESLLP